MYMYIKNIINPVPLTFLKLLPGNLTEHSRILQNIPTVCIKYSQESFEMSNTKFVMTSDMALRHCVKRFAVSFELV